MHFRHEKQKQLEVLKEMLNERDAMTDLEFVIAVS